MRIIYLIIIIWYFSTQTFFAAESINEELFNAAKNQLSQSYTDDDIRNSIKLGLWNPDKSAIVVTFHSEKKTTIFMLIPDKEKNFRAVDISLVENGNLGKIGIAKRKSYSKVISVPVEWMKRKDDNYQIKIRTRAWKDGQRYTVYEPLIVKSDGIPIYR